MKELKKSKAKMKGDSRGRNRTLKRVLGVSKSLGHRLVAGRCAEYAKKTGTKEGAEDPGPLGLYRINGSGLAAGRWALERPPWLTFVVDSR
jgi:hypothetical protein